MYYLAYAGSAVCSAYGLLYLYDKDQANGIVRRVTWNAVKAYHKINLEIDNLKRQYGYQKPKYTKVAQKEKKDTDDEEELVDNTDPDTDKNIIIDRDGPVFIGYSSSSTDMYPIITTSNLDNNENIFNMDFDLMFIKQEKEGKVYLKRIEDKNVVCADINVELIDKPFLQVEISQTDIEGSTERVSIHKYLDDFYVAGNKLFDKTFLKWYMMKYYSIELADNYTLYIIDADINMLSLDQKEFIKLMEKKEIEKTYTVMNDNNK